MVRGGILFLALGDGWMDGWMLARTCVTRFCSVEFTGREVAE